jgi:hypothetical protein
VVHQLLQLTLAARGRRETDPAAQVLQDETDKPGDDQDRDPRAQ